ncbi:MAG: PAS domain S-box protein, partial [bacterium]
FTVGEVNLVSGLELRVVAEFFWFVLFCALLAIAYMAHRRTQFLHPRCLFFSLILLWLYGLTNVLEMSATFRSLTWISRGLIHDLAHDFVFPVFGSLLVVVTLIWEVTSRSRHMKDISSRMQDLLNNIILSSPEAVIAYDEDSRVTLWNDAAERLFGYARKEVLGKRMWEYLVSPEFQHREKEVCEYLRTKGSIIDYPTPMVTRDGRSLRLRVSSFLIKDDNGAVVGRASIYRRSGEEERLAFLVGSFRSHLDVNRGFKDFTDGLQAMAPHDEAIIFAKNEAEDTLRSYVSTQSAQNLRLLPVSVAPTSILIQTLRDGFRCVGDLAELIDPSERKVLEMARMRSCVALRLNNGDEIVGVLALFAAHPNAFRQEHERVLRLLVQHLGPALSNMRLFSALSDYQTKLAGSSEEADYGVALVSLDSGQLVSGNRTLSFMLDVPEGAISSYRLIDLIASDSRDKFEDLFQKNQEEETFLDEVQLTALNGDIVWAEVRGKILKHGGHPHALLMFRDLTDRRRLFNELAAREQRYRFLLESVGEINDIVYLIDSQGEYLYCNKSFREILGYDVEDFAINREHYLTDNPLNRYVAEKQRRESETEGRENHPFLLELYDIQKKKVLFEVTEKQLLLQDGTIGWIGVMRNITERRLLEERILQDNQELTLLNERLERLAKVKDEFLANTSHELRTPLNSILGFITLLLEESSLSHNESREFMQSIHRSAQHLMTLINDILDIAKLESSEVQMDAQLLSVDDIFTEVRSISHVQARERDLSLVFEPVPSDKPPIKADREKVVRILLNLVSNAIKFTPKGRVVIRTCYDYDPGFVRIEVEDTGIGIPKEMHEAVFEAFRQVNGSSTRPYGGTGLGLTICRQLVKLMGGSIWIESEGIEKGTSVFFTLPLAATTHTGKKTKQTDLAPAQERS